jgi:hypothetical protein
MDEYHENEASFSKLDFLPEGAKRAVEEGVEWIRAHPTEAAIAGAVGGLIIGLTGVGRIVRGVNAVRAIPYVSQIAFGAIAQGLAAKGFGKAPDAVH